MVRSGVRARQRGAFQSHCWQPLAAQPSRDAVAAFRLRDAQLQEPPPSPPPPPPSAPLGRVVVHNLPFRARKEDVWAHLSRCGPLQHVALARDGARSGRNLGYCFATFAGIAGPAQSLVIISVFEKLIHNLSQPACWSTGLRSSAVLAGEQAAASAEGALLLDRTKFMDKEIYVMLDDGRRESGLGISTGRLTPAAFRHPCPLVLQKCQAYKSWRDNDVKIGARQMERGQDSQGPLAPRRRSCEAEHFRLVLEKDAKDLCAVLAAFKGIKKPVRGDYGLLVTALARQGDKHSARSHFEAMRARGIEPDAYIYTSSAPLSNYPNLNMVADLDLEEPGLVHAYAKAGDVRGAEACARDMVDDGLALRESTYSTLILAHGRANDLMAADNTFLRMKAQGIRPSAVLYSNIISVQCKGGNMRRAEELLAEMQWDGLDPPLAIYNAIMDGYAQAVQLDQCLLTLSRIQQAGYELNIVTYGCLINLHVNRGDMEAAHQMLEKMVMAGIKPKQRICSMLLAGFAKSNPTEAFSMFSEMVSWGVEPDVVMYNSLVSAACYQGDVDHAIALLSVMRQRNISPSYRTYTTILSSMVQRGYMERAMSWLHKMRLAGCQPSHVTFNIIINGHACRAQMNEAEDVMRQMKQAGLRPNIRTFTILLCGYADSGDYVSAFKCLEAVKAAGLQADVTFYGALIKANCRAGRLQAASLLLDEMVETGVRPNERIFTTIINGWALRGDVWEAEEAMSKMRHFKLTPDVHTYTSLLNAACKAGDMERAEEVMAEMEAAEVPANQTTFATLIHGWASALHPEKALASYEKMKAAGLQGDLPVYHCLLSCLLSRAAVTRGGSGEAGFLCVAAEMIEQGLHVDEATACHWLKVVRRIEHRPGPLSEALVSVAPADWSRASCIQQHEDPTSPSHDGDDLALPGTPLVELKQQCQWALETRNSEGCGAFEGSSCAGLAPLTPAVAVAPSAMYGNGVNGRAEELEQTAAAPLLRSLHAHDRGRGGAGLARGSAAVLLGSRLNVLLLFLPLALCAALLQWRSGYVFGFCLISLAPLAERLSFITEQLAMSTSTTVGGLLNATFSNAPELILVIVALKAGKTRVIQLSLLGSIVGNLLLCLGSAFISGGLRFHTQTYNAAAAQMHGGLLLLGLTGLLLPNLLHATSTELHLGTSELELSRFAAFVILAAYCCYVYFQLVSHRELFKGPESAEDEGDEEQACTLQTLQLLCPAFLMKHLPEVLNLWGAILWLAAVTLLISILSDYVVDTVDDYNVPISFLCVVLLPLMNNVAEHASAIIFGFRNKLDLSLGIAIGSSIQLSMFLLPVAVIGGWIIGEHMDLNLHRFETCCLFITVLVTCFLVSDGSANYLKGTLASDNLSDDADSKAQLGHTADKELVCLGEAKELACNEGGFDNVKSFDIVRRSRAEPKTTTDALAGVDDRLVNSSHGLRDELAAIAQPADGTKEGEEDEEDQEGLGLIQGQASLNVELSKGALASQRLPEKRSLPAEVESHQ
eukprot:SM000342S12976  [mRNA]  locus=s342:58271:70155:- [translate_table: standard]